MKCSDSIAHAVMLSSMLSRLDWSLTCLFNPDHRNSCCQHHFNLLLKNQSLAADQNWLQALSAIQVFLLVCVCVVQLQLSTMNPAVLNKIPEEVREHVKMLLSVTPTVRPDADQITKVCIRAATMQLQCIWLFVRMAFLTMVFTFNPDSFFWWRWCHDPAIFWLPLPKRQPAEVPVLQGSAQSPPQATQGKLVVSFKVWNQTKSH